jgi:hypothetical protein
VYRHDRQRLAATIRRRASGRWRWRGSFCLGLWCLEVLLFVESSYSLRKSLKLGLLNVGHGVADVSSQRDEDVQDAWIGGGNNVGRGASRRTEFAHSRAALPLSL